MAMSWCCVVAVMVAMREVSGFTTTSPPKAGHGLSVVRSGGKGSVILRAEPEPRELGAMECLFLPRRSELASCGLPPTVHVCAAWVPKAMSDEALLAGATRAARRHALLRAKVTGDGAPRERGPMGAPLAKAGVLKNVLAPFGDDNMRVGRPPKPLRFEAMAETASEAASKAMEPTEEARDEADAEARWKAGFVRGLEGKGGSSLFGEATGKAFDFDTGAGPLWRFKAVRCGSGTGLLLGFDHAISDQPSAMAVVEDILGTPEKTISIEGDDDAAQFPPSLEMSILDGRGGRSRGFWSEALGGTGLLALDKGSAKYLLSKVWGERACVSPLTATKPTNTGATSSKKKNTKWIPASARGTKAVFRDVPAETVSALRAAARKRGETVGGLLAAASALALGRCSDEAANTTVKVLQSLDMRKFAENKAAVDRSTLACQAGSMDLALPTTGDAWEIAAEASKQLNAYIDRGFGVDSVRVFDWAVDAMEMARLIELEADNPFSKGRAYASGVSNAGVYSSTATRVYYATSTAYAGSAFQAYVLTLDGDKGLCACFTAVDGVVDSVDRVEAHADAFLDVLAETLAAEKNNDPPSSSPPREREETGVSSTTQETASSPVLLMAPPPSLDTVTASLSERKNFDALTDGRLCALLGAVIGVAPHLDAWAAFFQAAGRALEGVDGNVAELAAPFGFWLFFAVTHPLIGGAGVGLGELAWQFPGYIPASGDLDAVGPPLLFTLASAACTSVILGSKVGRAVAALAASTWFSAAVTAGVAGTTHDLGSYNLALDDAPYPLTQPQLKGCPSFDAVADPKVRERFDAFKYQGTWYEHAYHDWTQFSEVYDTALDIDLASDQRTWVDIFRVKGPSPEKASHSWRGSPVANGAAYPLYGDLPDAKEPVIQEFGFGNTFPNYVVDLQTDPKTGEYTESIQFQCLEAGGVRVFEGINFLSRSPSITDAQLAAMFQRAAKIAPYGATPDQMHIVSHNPPDFKPVDNWWQQAWRFIGFDKLLELIAADL